MAYAIKDTASGKYMSKTKTLESGTSNAMKYESKVAAESAAARLKKIYDNWEANNGLAESRGYTNAYKALTPKPIWKVESVS